MDDNRVDPAIAAALRSSVQESDADLPVSFRVVILAVLVICVGSWALVIWLIRCLFGGP